MLGEALQRFCWLQWRVTRISSRRNQVQRVTRISSRRTRILNEFPDKQVYLVNPRRKSQGEWMVRSMAGGGPSSKRTVFQFVGAEFLPSYISLMSLSCHGRVPLQLISNQTKQLCHKQLISNHVDGAPLSPYQAPTLPRCPVPTATGLMTFWPKIKSSTACKYRNDILG